jgi:ribosomal-protein-alanine N-acetyltransferase
MGATETSDIKIREAKLYDLPAMTRMERESFDSYQGPDNLSKELNKNDGSNYIAVAESGDDKIGYANIHVVRGEAQLYSIAIDSSCRGQGIGEMLLSHMIDKSRTLGCDIMTLEVREGNTAAIELYKKLGFKEVGRRKGYYRKEKEDAILMDKELVAIEISVNVE